MRATGICWSRSWDSRLAKLKVYRTPIGFHDAYVAAPSRAAALRAWGSDADLFARGVAEVVDDPALTAEPLAAPGRVIRRSRGTADEQLAAATPPDRPERRAAREAGDDPPPNRRARGSAGHEPVAARAKPAKMPTPRPDRNALDAAERALAQVEARHADEDRDWRRRQDELDRERRDLDRSHRDDRERLALAVEQARDAYDRAVRLWRADR